MRLFFSLYLNTQDLRGCLKHCVQNLQNVVVVLVFVTNQHSIGASSQHRQHEFSSKRKADRLIYKILTLLSITIIKKYVHLFKIYIRLIFISHHTVVSATAYVYCTYFPMDGDMWEKYFLFHFKEYSTFCYIFNFILQPSIVIQNVCNIINKCEGNGALKIHSMKIESKIRNTIVINLLEQQNTIKNFGRSVSSFGVTRHIISYAVI